MSDLEKLKYHTPLGYIRSYSENLQYQPAPLAETLTMPDKHQAIDNSSTNPNAAALARRLNIIEGQVRGIKKMVANDAYCIDVMKQIKSVKNALEKVNTLVLEGHMKTCVTTRLRSDDPQDREQVIAEVVGVFSATGKL